MFSRTITFKDQFTGEPREETYWFELSMSDATDLEILERDDVQEYLTSIIEGQNGAKMLKVMKMLAWAAVGRREGNRFVKDGVAKEFRENGTWNALFSELMQEKDAGLESFYLKILPTEIKRQAEEQAAKKYTDEELLAMSDEDFYRAAGTKKFDEMNKRFSLIAYKRKIDERKIA